MITRQLISAIILGTISTTAISANSECNSSKNLSGWGAWCGIDTFLGQQEPTAAGGPLFNPQNLSSASFDSDELGGKFTPIKNEEDIVVGWVGYAITPNNMNMYTTLSSDSQLGLLKVDLDLEGQVVKITGLFEDGSTLDLSSEWFMAMGPYYVYAGSQSFSSHFSSDYKSYENDSPEMYTGSANNYVGTGDFIGGWSSQLGKATPIADITNFKNIGANFAYQVNSNGTQNNGPFSSGIGSRAIMNVQFGSSSWSMDNLHGFDSKGKISGNTFKSTEIKGVAGAMNSPAMMPMPYPGGNSNFANHTVTSDSSINGVFIGSNAKGLIGQTNITAVKDGQATTLKTILNGSQVMGDMQN